MLTTDQLLAAKRLVPAVQEFLKPSYHSDKSIELMIHTAMQFGHFDGMVRLEFFNLDNVEGIRVQYGHSYKYFAVKAEGPIRKETDNGNVQN